MGGHTGLPSGAAGQQTRDSEQIASCQSRRQTESPVVPATMHAPLALTLPVTGGHGFKLPFFAGWKGGRSCTWQDLGFLPPHVRHVGRWGGGWGGPLGQMNQSLPSSNSLLFVLLQVENALSPPRCPGRHPHALPGGPEACLQERPFLPTNPCKATDQTRPSLPLRSFGGYTVEGTLLWRPRTWEGRAPQGCPFLPRSFSEHLSAGCQAQRLAPSVFLSLNAS